MVEFRVLGPLEVTQRDRQIEITAPKQRAVLAVLLLSANQVVSFDRMIEHLWGDEPPPRATAALQLYVSNLRRAFEPDRAPRSPGRVLLSKPPGYVLCVDPGELDAARFSAAVPAAQAHLADGEPEEAMGLLDAALELWRGPAYAEFAEELFAQAETARLEMLRVTAMETRAEAGLALGFHVRVASDLEALVARYPFRESLWASYLLALYRGGRQADALRAYQTCRTALIEELGIGPGPALRRLEAAILAQDPALDWRPPHPATTPARSVPTAGALIGRTAESQRLEATWSATRAGRGSCVLVSGEAGIGKTRLVDEVAGRWAAAGAEVVWGRCQEGVDAPAFWPWAQVVRSLLALRPPETAVEVLGPLGLEPADLAPLGLHVEGAAGERPHLVEPGAARFRLYQTVTALITSLAAERPVVIVLDDLHWADVATLALLRSLAPEVDTARVLLVATYRDEEVADDHPLVETLAWIARLPRVERIALGGLSEAEVADFVTAATDGRASRAVVESVYRRTDGNPFFVGEVVRLLESENALDDPGVAAGTGVPAGVRDVIRRRLAQLPEQTNAVLAIAAVVGQEFDLTVVETVAGLAGDGVLDVLEPARRSGVIVEGAGPAHRFRFCHALLHEVLCGGMSALRRSRLHARVADTLEARSTPPRPVELAYHLWRATPVAPPERVLSALLGAAEEAMSGLAYEQAGEQLSRAIELLATFPPGEDRDRQELWAQVRLGMVLATIKGNPSPGVVTSFARAKELCARVTHAPEQLPTLYGLFLVAWIQTDFEGAANNAMQLLEVARTTRDPTFVVAGHQALGLIAFEHGELAVARHHFAQAVVTADSLADPWLGEVLQGDPSVTGRCFGAFVEALWGHRSDADALAEEGLRRARLSGHSWSIGVALNMRTWVAVVLRQGDVAEQYADETAAYIAKQGFELLAAATSCMRGWAKAVCGDVASGQELLESGLRGVEATGLRLMLSFNLALIAEVQHAAGRTDRALVTVQQGLAEVEKSGERFYEAELHRLRSELLVASAPERATEAEACLRRAVEVARSQGAALLEDRALQSLGRLQERLQASL